VTHPGIGDRDTVGRDLEVDVREARVLFPSIARGATVFRRTGVRKRIELVQVKRGQRQPYTRCAVGTKRERELSRSRRATEPQCAELRSRQLLVEPQCAARRDRMRQRPCNANCLCHRTESIGGRIENEIADDAPLHERELALGAEAFSGARAGNLQRPRLAFEQRSERASGDLE